MPVAIEPRRFGKHKIYHIILQEEKNNLLAAGVQIHDVIDKNEHFHLQSTPCTNVWTGAKGSNRINCSIYAMCHLVACPFIFVFFLVMKRSP